MSECVNHRDEPDDDRQPRTPGRSQGQIEISDDLDAPVHDLEAEIYNVGD